jgi:hypothetical protein
VDDLRNLEFHHACGQNCPFLDRRRGAGYFE